MNLLEKLELVSKESQNLEEFLKEEIQHVYDYFLSQPYHILKEQESLIENYIFNNHKVIRGLDLTSDENISFVTILLDVCERFGFLLYFKRFYQLLQSNGCEISARIEASALYLIDIKNFSDYDNAFKNVLEKLNEAFEQEEDNDDKVISTLINYYAQVVYNFGQFNKSAVESFRNKLKGIKEDYYFTNSSFFDTILSIDTLNHSIAYQEINQTLDAFLSRAKVDLFFSESKYLIEEDTPYTDLIKDANPDFSSIRNISVAQYQPVQSDKIFYSLGRGVKILTEENQLFAYMFSYGKMHYAKLNSAFEQLPVDIFDNELEIFDWGCGQALASTSLFDFLQKNGINRSVRRIILNEPSNLAIKRGALHINKFDKELNIHTINKDLDSLVSEDFLVNDSIKLHLFSNILDIDLFSMNQLVTLLKNTFSGVNYFAIVSPYVSEMKKNRLDSFVNSFSENEGFELIDSFNRHKGDWVSNWSIMRRVFKCSIQP